MLQRSLLACSMIHDYDRKESKYGMEVCYVLCRYGATMTMDLLQYLEMKDKTIASTIQRLLCCYQGCVACPAPCRWSSSLRIDSTALFESNHPLSDVLRDPKLRWIGRKRRAPISCRLIFITPSVF